MTTEAPIPETSPTPEPTTPAIEAPPPPVDYSAIKLPDGYAADAPGIAKLRELAEAHKIPVAALQAQVDALIAGETEAKTSWSAQLDKWTSELKADAEVGGAKLDENMAHVNKWLDSYGGAELKQLLDESGLGKHPLLVKALIKAGKDAAEAPVIKASAPAAADIYRAMYPNSPSMFSQ